MREQLPGTHCHSDHLVSTKTPISCAGHGSHTANVFTHSSVFMSVNTSLLCYNKPSHHSLVFPNLLSMKLPKTIKNNKLSYILMFCY